MGRFYFPIKNNKKVVPDFSRITNITANAFPMIFANYKMTTLSFPNLTRISGNNAMQHAFNGCNKLTSVSFPNLTTIYGDYAMNDCFRGCTALTSVSFPRLSEISSSNALRYCFSGCTTLTSVSFPSLEENSFGIYENQFNQMLSGVTGCTVHFPENLEIVISRWSDVESGFGGTNTTILFDLESTEVVLN